MTTDNRNVADHYKFMETELIKGDLDTKRHNFSVLTWNLSMDFNIATVVRNCNAFLGRTFYVYGNKRWDKRGAVGTHHYEHVKHVTSLDDVDVPKDTLWVGIDNVADAEAIETFKWPKDRHVLMCFGMEQLGLDATILARCEKKLFIKQYGSVRSLNVGCASAIAMFSYMAQQ